MILRRRSHNLSRSSCDFLGIISSICDARSGYVSIILERMARWADDLTLDFEPAEILFGLSIEFFINSV